MAQPAPLPIPTHGHSPCTVLIDLQSAKPSSNRDDRSRFVLVHLGVDPLTVTSLFVEPVTQLYAVTFNQQEAFQAVVERLRRGVPWPLAPGRLVYGWPASEGLQKVRVTAVPDYVTVDQLSAHMGQCSRRRGGGTGSSHRPMMGWSTSICSCYRG